MYGYAETLFLIYMFCSMVAALESACDVHDVHVTRDRSGKVLDLTRGSCSTGSLTGSHCKVWSWLRSIITSSKRTWVRRQ